jgi:hypothetical protein
MVFSIPQEGQMIPFFWGVIRVAESDLYDTIREQTQAVKGTRQSVSSANRSRVKKTKGLALL